MKNTTSPAIDGNFEIVQPLAVDPKDLKRVRALVKSLDDQIDATRNFSGQAILTAHDLGHELSALQQSLNLPISNFELFAENTFGLPPKRTATLIKLGTLSRDRLQLGCSKELRQAYHQLDLMPEKERVPEGANGRPLVMAQTWATFINAFTKWKRRIDLGRRDLIDLDALRRDARPLFDWLNVLYAGE